VTGAEQCPHCRDAGRAITNIVWVSTQCDPETGAEYSLERWLCLDCDRSFIVDRTEVAR